MSMFSTDSQSWTQKCSELIGEALAKDFDPAHDLAHVRRVVRMATQLANQEGADLDVVLPAAWLHDLVNLPKNDPRRSQASRLSAEAAVTFLREHGYEASRLDAIFHAIEAHSYSARIEPRTIEASVVQDADRLDALGAIGIARCFTVSGKLGRLIYDEADPFASERPLDDQKFTIDHFETKLYRLVELLRTEAGRAEGQLRTDVMRGFIAQLKREISS